MFFSCHFFHKVASNPQSLVVCFLNVTIVIFSDVLIGTIGFCFQGQKNIFDCFGSSVLVVLSCHFGVILLQPLNPCLLAVDKVKGK